MLSDNQSLFVTAKMCDKTYCPIVSLLSKYADYSSCYITPNRRHHLYYAQEWAVEALLDYLAARLTKIILPARNTTATTTTLDIRNTTEEGEEINTVLGDNDKDSIEKGEEEKLTDYRQPVYLYIELAEFSDSTKPTILSQNVHFRTRNNERENCHRVHIRKETQILEIRKINHMKQQQQKQQQPTMKNAGDSKQVRFNLTPEVHLMHTWSFAYRAARKGEWHLHAVDRSRFQMRVLRASLYLNPIMTPEHRNKIFTSRFSDFPN